MNRFGMQQSLKGTAVEERHSRCDLVRENARHLARGEPLVNVVDKAKGY